MHPVAVIILIYALIGFAGTVLANRNQTAQQRRRRWIKFSVYILLTFALLGVLLSARPFFPWVALCIIGLGIWELWKVRREGLTNGHEPGAFFHISSFLIYAVIAWGFYCMAAGFGDEQLLANFLLVFTFDGFSQIAGQIAGRRKLFPVISPQKTVEGLLGGVFMTLLTAGLLFRGEHGNLFEALGLGLLTAFGALSGDWLASLYKRRYGVKDFSNLIPGHGGVLDRFDSWLAAGALVWWVDYFL